VITAPDSKFSDFPSETKLAQFILDSDSSRYEPAMTFGEIAQVLGVTKERARQIYERALNKLRQNHPCVEELRSMIAMRNRIREGL